MQSNRHDQSLRMRIYVVFWLMFHLSFLYYNFFWLCLIVHQGDTWCRIRKLIEGRTSIHSTHIFTNSNSNKKYVQINTNKLYNYRTMYLFGMLQTGMLYYHWISLPQVHNGGCGSIYWTVVAEEVEKEVKEKKNSYIKKKTERKSRMGRKQQKFKSRKTQRSSEKNL